MQLRHIKKEEKVMKFNPCIAGQCTEEGSHCQGCGRSHQEIAETKKMVGKLVEFAKRQEYDNIEVFADFIAKNIVKKTQTLEN